MNELFAYIQKESKEWILSDLAWNKLLLAQIVYIFLENYWAILNVQFLKFLGAQINMTSLAKEMV